MDEYIEKRAALDEAKKHLIEQGCDCEVMIAIFEELQGLPTADVAPVVHGLWLPEHHKDKVSQTEYHSYIWYHCSECGRRLIGCRNPREAPYCHCGAKMDLRGEDNNGSEKA